MGLNLGAFAGGLAQGGANTYFKLGEMQRQEEELAMRKQEAAYLEEQRDQERKLNEITSQTLGMGDTRVTGQDYTGVTGGIDTAEPTLKTEAYTPQQKMADFKQRALGAGIPLQKVTAVSGAHRAEKYAEREELALGFSQQVMDDIKANPNDLGAVFNKHFKDQYNEGKLPGLGDGKTAEVVPVATGGQSIVLKDAKGKVTKTIPLNVDTIQAMTQKWAGAMMASSSPASWWKNMEMDLKKEEVGAKTALVPSEIRKNNAAADYYSAHGAALGAGGGGKPTSRTVMVGGGVDASGAPVQKQPVTIVTKFDKTGAPVVSAFDLSGKPITDQKLLGQAQMAAAQGGTEEGGGAPLSSVGLDLASARKRYESGNLSLEDYNKEVAAIKLMGGLPKPGGTLNPNAGATPEKPKAGVPVRTAGQKQFDAAVAKQGFKPFGAIDGVDRYIKDGVQITAPDLAKQLHLEY